MKSGHPFSLTIMVLLSALWAAAAAQQSQLGSPTEQLSEKLVAVRVRSAVVFGFSGPTREGNQLGRFLADEFAVSLSAKGFRVLESRNLDPIVKENDLHWDELRDINVACWVSREAGAEALVSGYLESTADSVNLTIKAYETKGRKELASVKVQIALTEHMRNLLAQPLSDVSEKVPGAGMPKDDDETQGIPVAGKRGFSYASCKECPSPEYTPKAREAKYQGRVLLRALISPKGRAVEIRVIRGAGFGLAEKAVDAVRKWRFKPATGPDGRPLAVWQDIEINFRIF